MRLKRLRFQSGILPGSADMAAQFDKIAERALSLSGRAKKPLLHWILFGGKRSKLLMLIKQSGRSYRDLMDEQRRYNLVTKEGLMGRCG